MTDRKAALITGAARRVGRAIALHLAREGWDIAVHYRASRTDAEALAREIAALGVACRLYRFDLAEPDAAPALIDAFCDDFPAAGLLVNSAAMFERDTIDRFDLALWQGHMALNALAPILLARRFFERITMAGTAEPGDTANVVNILDQKVANLTPDYFSYTIAKAALASATQMLAMAFWPHVRVNGVAPGLVLPSGGQSEAEFRAMHGQTPLGVGVTVEDIGRTITYMVATPSLTGEIITLAGGANFIRKPPFRDLPGA